jgi:hypothetical protein
MNAGKNGKGKTVRILSKKVTSEDFKLSQLEYGNLVTSNPIKKRIFELDKNIHVGRVNSIIEIGRM